MTTEYNHISCGIISSCKDCQSLYGMTRLEIEQSEPANEPSIGYNCDLCGNPGGLMRDDIYDGHGIDSKGAIVHLDICSDCLAKL